MPPKLKDPGNFSFPCAIYKMQIYNALCDLEASVSLMPYSVYQRVELGELFPTNITLQLADRSIKIPKAKVVDVPLRVGKFVIPINFVVLEMDEDANIPIILSRPFLATSGATSDVKSAKISHIVGEEVIEFDLNESMKYHSSSLKNCMRVENIDNIVNSMHEHLLTSNDPLECVLLNKENIGDHGKELVLFEMFIDGSMEESDAHICMGITIQDALQLASTKEGKGVPMVELKPLPSHLRYEFLGPNSTFPVIVSSSLSESQAQELCGVLRRHQGALGYTIDDLKGGSIRLCNALATFQRCMMGIFGDMLEEEMEVFMDDFSMVGVSFEDYLVNLERCLAHCEKVNLVLNWEKCHFMVEEGIVLGHKISHKGIEVDKAKIEVIEKLPPPVNVKGVRSFLGHAGFYRRFIKDFSLIAKPLNDLLQKDVEFNFDDRCLEAYNKFKNALISTPIVQAPRWELPFELMGDVSDTAIGGVLGQRVEKRLHVMYYMSKTLSALNYLISKKESKPRLIRWVLELQTFDVEIRDKKGAKNVVADCLSRLEDFQIPDDGFPIEDRMLDDSLYAINMMELPWFADLVNYLACGEFPPSFSTNQRRKLKREARHYLWDDPILYKCRVDGLLRRCVPNEEVPNVLKMCHSDPSGGHMGVSKTASKILQCGLWWLYLFKNTWGLILLRHVIDVNEPETSQTGMKCLNNLSLS
ncbi:uncharacterized protein LOC110684893 [Chenopodium quinoa]|uniref:uncharacterized protein LOC110684893 n=1 Tax=Chenopodium quinoa TaxID=63459 RepID=UPI000B794848|nr:uncharacterized protein LOC110684893 [Chenopodium quinoa]